MLELKTNNKIIVALLHANTTCKCYKCQTIKSILIICLTLDTQTGKSSFVEIIVGGEKVELTEPTKTTLEDRSRLSKKVFVSVVDKTLIISKYKNQREPLVTQLLPESVEKSLPDSVSMAEKCEDEGKHFNDSFKRLCCTAQKYCHLTCPLFKGTEILCNVYCSPGLQYKKGHTFESRLLAVYKTGSLCRSPSKKNFSFKRILLT